MVFLVRGKGAENIEKKKKTARKKKTFQNEKREKRRIQGKSNDNNKHLWFYLSYKKLYFARKHSLKKISLYYLILFTVFLLCKIFETQ